MKKIVKYILLISIISACQTQENCTTLGCQVVEYSKEPKQKKNFFKKNKKKKKLRKEPQKGLFPNKVLKQTK